MTVQASDNGNPPRLNTTTVNIDVSDVNDNPPVFSKGNYSVIIQVNTDSEVVNNIIGVLICDLKDSARRDKPNASILFSVSLII